MYAVTDTRARVTMRMRVFAIAVLLAAAALPARASDNVGIVINSAALANTNPLSGGAFTLNWTATPSAAYANYASLKGHILHVRELPEQNDAAWGNAENFCAEFLTESSDSGFSGAVRNARRYNCLPPGMQFSGVTLEYLPLPPQSIISETPTTTAVTRTLTIHGAPSGTYQLRMRANGTVVPDPGHEHPWSAVQTIFIPPPPSDVQVTRSGDGSSIDVTWTAPTATGSAPLSTSVRHGSGASWSTPAPVSSGTSHTITGVTAGVEYKVQVGASHDGGTNFVWSDTVTTAAAAAPPADATIKELRILNAADSDAVLPVEFEQEFLPSNAARVLYELENFPGDISSVKVQTVLTNPTLSYTISAIKNGGDVQLAETTLLSGAPTPAFTLEADNFAFSNILITVTAADGVTQLQYGLQIISSADVSGDATLSALTAKSVDAASAETALTITRLDGSAGGFAPLHTAYYATGKNAATLALTPTASASASTLADGDDNTLTSAAANSLTAPQAGMEKTYAIVVTAGNGWKKTYTLQFFNRAAADASLRSFAATADGGALTFARTGGGGGFAPEHFSYDAVLANASNATFSVLARDPAATITLNGAAYSAAASPLTFGHNAFRFLLTAETTTTATYTFNIRNVDKADVDLSGTHTAQDGILIARFLLGVRGVTLSDGQSGAAGGDMEKNIAATTRVNADAFNVNAAGGAPDETDAIIIARYFAGVRGAGLLRGLPGASSDAAVLDALETKLRALGGQ